MLTAEQCAAYVEALKDGKGAIQARELVGVARSAVVNTCKANPEFLAQCEEAKSTRAAALLELAERATVEGAENPAKAAIAKSLSSAASQLAEKLAPREYGPKLAFDEASGPAIIQIMSFARVAPPSAAPIALEAHNVSDAQ
jgi:hypothetical protein